MKKSFGITLVIAVVALLLGFMIGRSYCPVTRAIRKAQKLTVKGIAEKKEAMKLLDEQKAFIELALKNVQLEETRKVISLSLGKKLLEHEMWIEALKYLNEAYSLLPGDYSINQSLAIAYSSMYRLEQDGAKKIEYQRSAFKHLEAALKVRPDNADSHYLIGMMYYYDAQIDQAYQHFSQVLKRYPDDVNSLLAVARILYDKGDIESARKIYLKLENQLPANHPKAKQIEENLRKINEGSLDG